MTEHPQQPLPIPDSRSPDRTVDAAAAQALPAPRPWRVVLRLVLVALLCGIFQALLPRYEIGADSLGPLSVVLGLAVAAAATRGRWTVPAALLGVALADAFIGTTLRHGLIEIAVIGAQATLAGWLLRHDSDPELLSLDTRPRLQRFLLLVAPLTAGLGTVLHTAVLAPGHAEPLAVLLIGSAARLVADWTGIVVTAPVLLTWLAQPPQAWRHRQRMLVPPVVALSAMMLFGFTEVARRDEARLAVRFEREAAARQIRVQAQMAGPLDALRALRGALAAGGGALSPTLFDDLAKPWAEQRPGIVSLGWFERVQKDTLRQPAAKLLPAPPTSDGSSAPSAEQPPAMALRHAFGQRLGALAALGQIDSGGVNAMAVPALRQALQRALAANQVVVNTAMPLDDQGRVGVMLTQALPATGAGATTVAYALIDLDTLVSKALPEGDEFVSACLTDGQAAGPLRRLAGPTHCDTGTLAANDRAQSSRVNFGDKRLNLVITQAAGADTRLLSAVWLLALPTVIGIAMLSALMLALSGRLRRIEDRVRERTLALQTEMDERRQAQRAQSESEARFRTIFDSVNIGLTLLDMDGRIAMANPAFCKMTGYAAPDLLHRPLSDIRLPDVAEDDGTAAALAGDQARRQRYLTHDGRVLQVAASIHTLTDASGQAVATVGALQDLTDMLRLRQAERERETAVAANRTKTDFLARLSHELRAPLNAIVGFAQVLSGTEGSPADPIAQQRALAQIRQTGWQLSDMVNDVLDLARIEAGELQLSPQPVPLADLLQETLLLVEPIAMRAQVALRLDLQDPTLAVQADPVRLRQVLVNLLGNGIKYNRRGGRVELRVAPDAPGMLLLEVLDDGIGMSAVQLSGLFTPFHRFGRHEPQSDGLGAHQGNGIGLALSRHLVDLMGGEMTVSSHPDEGSTFAIRLPRAESAVLPISTPSRQASPGGGTGVGGSVGSSVGNIGPAVSIGRVVYIADQASDVQPVRDILQQRPGVDLHSALSAREGLLAAAEADLLIIDLHLSDTPGLDVLRALKADPHSRSTPVIMVSADTLPERIDECFDLGALNYLTKPIDPQQLLRAVDDGLQG